MKFTLSKSVGLMDFFLFFFFHSRPLCVVSRVSDDYRNELLEVAGSVADSFLIDRGIRERVWKRISLGQCGRKTGNCFFIETSLRALNRGWTARPCSRARRGRVSGFAESNYMQMAWSAGAVKSSCARGEKQFRSVSVELRYRKLLIYLFI